MKKLSKERLITLIIVLCVIVLAFILLRKDYPETDEGTTKCIGSKAILYTQLGCRACKIQEDIFGENYKYLNVIDCWFEQSKCKDILHTPTWIIKNERYEGARSIEKLKELTGC